MEDLASQQDTMEIMDSSLYYKAARGEIDAFKQYDSEGLKQLVTRFDKNTILHIHITARCRFSSYPYLYYKCITDEALRDRDRSETVSVDFVKYVLQKCPVLLHQQNAKDETLLHIASRHGHEDIVKILADENKEDQEASRKMLRMVNKVKDSALHEAVRYGHLEVVKELIKIDSDYSCGVNDAGETPLYLAAEKGFSMAVDQMLKAGNSPAYQGPDGRTALHAAVLRQDEEMTQKIIGTIRFLETKTDKLGWLPLHYAAQFGYRNIVKILLDADESAAYIANKIDEKTPLHLAAENGHDHIMDELISRCTEMTKKIIDKMRYLATKADKQGWLPLHHAAQFGYLPIVKILLDADKSAAYIANKIDDQEKTPLHLAAQNGHCRIMDELIDRCSGCWEQVDAKGRNVLHHAVESNNDAAIFKILNDSSLSNLINEKDKDGNTPLHLQVTSTHYWKDFISHPKVDAHAFNNRNLNPLDIILSQDILFPPQKIYKKDLERLGIKSCQRIVDREESNNAFGKIGDDKIIVMKEAREAHLVVVTLIATVTFAAGFTLPGGYKSDEKDPQQGHAILTKDWAFKAFVVSDTIALMLSSSAVVCHLIMAFKTDKKILLLMLERALQLTFCALAAMMVAFITGTYAVLSHCLGLAIAVTTLCCLLMSFCLVKSLRSNRGC